MKKSAWNYIKEIKGLTQPCLLNIRKIDTSKLIIGKDYYDFVMDSISLKNGRPFRRALFNVLAFLERNFRGALPVNRIHKSNQTASDIVDELADAKIIQLYSEYYRGPKSLNDLSAEELKAYHYLEKQSSEKKAVEVILRGKARVWELTDLAMQKVFESSEFVNDAGNIVPRRELIAPSVKEPNLRSALKKGSVLFDKAEAFKNLQDYYGDIDNFRRSWYLMYHIPNGIEFVPNWKRSKTGRLIAYNPALQNIPKIVRYSDAMTFFLGSYDAFEFDFNGMFVNIAYVLNDEQPRKDPYEAIVEATNYDRDVIKPFVLSYLHGQTEGEYYYNNNFYNLDIMRERWNRITSELESIPAIQNIRSNKKGYHLLQNTESKIMTYILEKTGAGVPFHDGFIIGADYFSQGKIGNIMSEASKAVTRNELPFEMEIFSDKKREYEIVRNNGKLT